jgi:Clp amino terminal domain, pathogenicity island component
MLLYDDTAAAALRAADNEARRLGASRYETGHVLLGLLRTADPITRTATADHPELTVDAVRAALGTPPGTAVAFGDDDGATPGGGSKPEPAAEFRQAAKRFTAKWRPLVRSGRLRPGLKLGTGELWLTVLEPTAASARLLASVGAEPETVRALVLAMMAPGGAPPPDWPTAVPVGAVRRLLDRVFG